jgi:hypothetical protein
MLDARAMALITSDVAFFTPPNRPRRSERTPGRVGVVRTLVRAIRRELERATRTTESGNWMPRLTNYPY